ncbi:hypothetical protein CONCODRAFT_79458 [Conidiobolus coronatus NRRL 28638]|uniref:CCHC-type domain-containing protein n=1 Tax=Conidiobolus coronatus (strain ATCC 28846 / CBS 209.66 / NRRL 28638) TaxID=796925 RepID=A0A137P2C8_CONC2|nr:hypothetical protein CONCODRAFT_79458 [Conidiobolus coronatus NRRL 28638]|eukprot:KXN69172.1 hypothetical protein CONCODRAFT_79458 [Conidiobolus coronatus NRRL 28638]
MVEINRAKLVNKNGNWVLEKISSVSTKKIESGNSIFAVRKTASYTLAFDITNLYFIDSSFPMVNHRKINLKGMQFTEILIGGYEDLGANGGNFRPTENLIEVYFDTEELMEEAKSRTYEYENILFKPQETYNPEDQMMKIKIQPLPVSAKYGKGKEMEALLAKGFGQYGKVVSVKHHKLSPGSKFYSNRATVIIIPNDELIEGIEIIPSGIDFGGITSYIDSGPALKKCLKCKKIGHLRQNCENNQKGRGQSDGDQWIQKLSSEFQNLSIDKSNKNANKNSVYDKQ